MFKEKYILNNTLLCCIWSIVLFCISNDSSSQQRQNFNRNSFWVETIFNGNIYNRWKWQLDLQTRTMSDAGDIQGASSNLFKHAFQHVYRPWIHFQMNENVRFSFSPIGFWETWTPA